MDNQSFNLMLMIGGVAIALLALLLFLIKGKASALRHTAELLILLLSMGLLVCWMKPGTVGIKLDDLGGNPTVKPIEHLLVSAGYMAAFWMPVLLLIRFRLNRVLVIWASLGWWALLIYAQYLHSTAPLTDAFNKNDTLGLFKDTLILTTIPLAVARLWLWPVLSILGGFYTIRHHFSWGRLFIGTLVSGLAVAFLITPFLIWERFWLAPFCFAAFACLLVRLPIQRTSLENLFGFSIHRIPDSENTGTTPPAEWASLFGHLALLLAGILVAFSAAINYYEKQQWKILTQGAPLSWHSPAQANAYDSMKRLFVKGSDQPQFDSSKTPTDYYDKMIPLVTDQGEPAKLQKLLADTNANSIREFLQQCNDYITEYELASKADYMQYPSNRVASFLNLRETERAINRRSFLALQDGNTTLALNGTRNNLTMGGLLNQETNLVMQMIGVALRNEALKSSVNMMAVFPANREFLDGLAHLLKDTAPIGRQGINYDALKRGELGTMVFPIVPNADITVPAFFRAHNNTLISWTNFDLLQMAVALERYRLNHQAYPQALTELVPQYLPTIPREPFQGRDYTYIYKSPELYELFNPAIPNEKGISTPIHVPPMTYKEPAGEPAKK